MLATLARDVAQLDLKPLLAQRQAGIVVGMKQVLADLSAIRLDTPRSLASEPTRYDQAERLINAVMYALHLRAPHLPLAVLDFIEWGVGPFQQLAVEAYRAQGWPPRLAELVEPHRGLPDHALYGVEAAAQQIMAHSAMRLGARLQG